MRLSTGVRGSINVLLLIFPPYLDKRSGLKARQLILTIPEIISQQNKGLKFMDLVVPLSR